MKWMLSVVLVLVIHTLVWAQPGVGQKAGEIKLPDVKGNPVSLSSLKGKVVLIDFWASWCGPCRSSMPRLKQVYKKYKDKGLEVYGISVDGDRNSWKRAIFEDGTPWLQVIDAEGKYMTNWQIRFIPSTFLLDREGTVVAVNAEKEDLDRQLDKLLAR